MFSLLERLTIDFPSHFILSLIDVYKDMANHGKLIFPSAITRILHHFSISYPESPHFFVMCAIDVATIRRSVAQLRPRQPGIESVTPPASSSAGVVTLEAIMT